MGCASLQQYDEEHKPKGNPKGKPKDEADRRANALKRGGSEKFKHDKESFEKFKKELKELGMWVEPSDFAKLSPADKKSHTDKIRALCHAKQSQSTPTANPYT
jgi:hypothetical protein